MSFGLFLRGRKGKPSKTRSKDKVSQCTLQYIYNSFLHTSDTVGTQITEVATVPCICQWALNPAMITDGANASE